ncbi:anti-phage ZorAB system protein ZorA [Acidaminococcus provencensis]|uniref:anti-phage ZorAB system protein ZorA n=1 Tax=Acidaminococcus provencensis TaxID=2058289 RepID=UPI0022E8204E|nr:anti-phage ZorAB system protein ZorA [Acidaminococcus provencensis]
MGTFLTILLYGDYAGLVVVFYLCYKWFKKISKSSSSIKQVVDILQKYSKDSMKENYGNLMEEMEKAPYSPIWNKFKRSLFASPSEGVLMTQDPETFYNNQAILEEIPLQTFKAMPGIFTGLGLLGTFVGITQGISGIEFGNIEAMKNGIEVLLGGTKNAFITSVIGLLGALFYNVVDNYIYRPYTKKLATLIDQLNTLFPSKSLEEFLSHQAEQAEEQTDAMRELNGELVGRLEDMFVKLSQSIDVALKNNLKESFTQSLEPVFQDLNQSIDKLGSSAGDTLSKSIEQGAGDQIQGLAVTLQDFQGKMGNMMEVSEQLNAENTARLQGSVEMMVTKLNEAMDANIQKQATTSDASQAAMKQLVEEMNTNLKAALDQMVEAGRTANQALLQTTEATKGTIQEITDTMSQSTRTQRDEMIQVTANMKESVLDVLKQLQTDMQERNRTMDSYMAGLKEMLGHNREIMASAGKTADKFAQASTPMQKVADTLGSQLNLVVSASNQFNSHVDQNVQKLVLASQSSQKDLELIRDSMSTMRSAWENYQQTFQGVSREMREATDTLARTLEQYNTSTSKWLSETLGQYDKSIKEAMNSVSTINQSLSDSIQDLSDAMEKNRRH